ADRRHGPGPADLPRQRGRRAEGPASARRLSGRHAGMSDAGGLSVQDLVAGYVRGLPVVHGVSIEVARREIVTLIGPNGAGKSTLLKAIAGLIACEAGRVRLDRPGVAPLPAPPG